jgi:hypothetical protein
MAQRKSEAVEWWPYEGISPVLRPLGSRAATTGIGPELCAGLAVGTQGEREVLGAVGSSRADPSWDRAQGGEVPRPWSALSVLFDTIEVVRSGHRIPMFHVKHTDRIL